MYHVLLNAFLVKWGCKLLLGGRVCFLEDLATANGKNIQRRANGTEKNGDIKTVKVLTKGDVAEISHW